MQENTARSYSSKLHYRIRKTTKSKMTKILLENKFQTECFINILHLEKLFICLFQYTIHNKNTYYIMLHLHSNLDKQIVLQLLFSLFRLFFIFLESSVDILNRK